MKRFSSFGSFVERLESRIAPAGIVTVTVSGAHLTVTGDAGHNDITIENSSGNYLITGQNGTEVKLGAQGVPSTSVEADWVLGNSVTINLGEGDDVLQVDDLIIEKNLKINLGEGNNTAVLNTLEVGLNTSITAGGGNDAVSFGGSSTVLHRAVVIALGNGDNELVIASSDINNFEGVFTYTGGKGSDSLTGNTSSLRFFSNFTFNGLGGDNTLEFNNGFFEAGGHFTVKNGNGENHVTLRSGTLNIEGNLVIINGHSPEGEASSITVEGSKMDIVGNVKLQNGNGGSDTRFLSETFAVFHKSISVLGGSGDDTVTIDFDEVNLLGSLTVNTGAGVGDVAVGFEEYVFVKGNIVMKGGVHLDSFVIVAEDGGLVQGGLTMDLGKAGGVASVEGGENINLVVAGNSTFKMATTSMGFGQIQLLNLSANRLIVSTGEGDDTVDMADVYFSGTASLNMGGGWDRIFGDNMEVLASFVANMGTGEDMISLENDASFLGVQNFEGESRFAGPVTLNLGADDDSVSIGIELPDTHAVFEKTFKVNGGAGEDTLVLSEDVDANVTPVTVSVENYAGNVEFFSGDSGGWGVVWQMITNPNDRDRALTIYAMQQEQLAREQFLKEIMEKYGLELEDVVGN